jgi:phosphopantothenoylcysteine synthetase/decarboxylase
MSRRKKILVTAGPTRAYLDRVRFVSNFSTGELGFRLCDSLTRGGMAVAAVVGPTSYPFDRLKLSHHVSVETTTEMRDSVLSMCRKFRPDIVIFSAAVLDFEPARQEKGKVSSAVKNWSIKLKPTSKIIDEVGKKFPGVCRVGFKLEWERKEGKEAYRQAIEILEEKKLDALVLNFLSEIGKRKHPAVFVSRDGEIAEVSTKEEIARVLQRFALRAPCPKSS